MRFLEERRGETRGWAGRLGVRVRMWGRLNQARQRAALASMFPRRGLGTSKVPAAKSSACSRLTYHSSAWRMCGWRNRFETSYSCVT